MLSPKHIPIVDQIALRSIRHAVNAHIRRFDLPIADREDLIQEIALHLIERCCSFDPTLGAWATFVKCVVRNKLRSIQRAARSTKESSDHTTVSLNQRMRDCEGRATELGDLVQEGATPGQRNQAPRSALTKSDLKGDVGKSIERLEPELRAVCISLLQDRSIAEVAEELHVSRSTTYRRLEIIRESFTQYEIHRYL
jgi:RNA polymerase sigma factor (sigma-70 family)